MGAAAAGAAASFFGEQAAAQNLADVVAMGARPTALLVGLGATVYTQDDPAFPAGVEPIHDRDLEVSWHHDIETVPTLIRVVDGNEVERTVGWLQSDWRRITGVRPTLIEDFPGPDCAGFPTRQR